MITLRLSPKLLSLLDLLSRHQRISTVAFAERLISNGVRDELNRFPPEVASAMEILAAAQTMSDFEAGSSKSGVVEYEAPRLRFVKERIDRMGAGGKVRIRVKDQGVFEFSRQDLETDFRNVLESHSYNAAGYYHYATLPQKALKYRVADKPVDNQ
jgi:hypothetical protein